MDADMKSSETNTTTIISATSRSLSRNASPSRARRRSPGRCGSGWRLTASDTPAAATTTNEAASTVIASDVPPATTSRLPQTGPRVKPSERAVSTSPLARCSARSPATTGTSANSAACATAIPAPRTAASASSGTRDPTSASATATAAWPSDTTTSSFRVSTRSTSSPTWPESRTTGAQRQMNIAEIASPPPIPSPERFFAWRASATSATPSPSAESPIAADNTRRSRSRAIPPAPIERVSPLVRRPSTKLASDRVRCQAPRRRCVPEAEGEARRAEHRRGRGERAGNRAHGEHCAEPGGHDRHRDGSEHGEHDERDERELLRGNRGEKQHTDTRAAAHSVDEADPERAERRADGMPVTVARRIAQCEGPVVPAHEQAHREEDDQRRDTRLGPTLQHVGKETVGQENRNAEHEQRQRMSRAPPCAETRRRAGRALAAGGDERRDRGDVVRVGRMTKPQQRRDQHDDGERASLRQSCDPVVEPEHHRAPLVVNMPDSQPDGVRFGQNTRGSARAVIATPATTITAADTAGTARTSGPSNRARAKTRRARTATSPIPVIVTARPTLNATIRMSPNASRWSAIALRRTTSADGHGSRPAATPTPTRLRGPRSCA